MPKIIKGDFLLCLDIPRQSALEEGFNIHPGEIYEANNNSYMHDGQELVELVEDGDGVRETHYPIKFFKVY